MIVDYTGRQFDITPKVRKVVEAGLAKLSKIVGENCTSKAILGLEKQVYFAEITLKRRAATLLGCGRSTTMRLAIDEALEHLEKQALKFNARRRDTKRSAKAAWKREAPLLATETLPLAVGAETTSARHIAVPLMVHAFPAKPKIAEAHLIRSQEALAMQPMTVEEAVKECEFRDHGVLVFRDHADTLRVLHRRHDGKMELIEVP